MLSPSPHWWSLMFIVYIYTWNHIFSDQIPSPHGEITIVRMVPKEFSKLLMLKKHRPFSHLQDLVTFSFATNQPHTRAPMSNMLPDFLITGPDFAWKGYGGYGTMGEMRWGLNWCENYFYTWCVFKRWSTFWFGCRLAMKWPILGALAIQKWRVNIGQLDAFEKKKWSKASNFGVWSILFSPRTVNWDLLKGQRRVKIEIGQVSIPTDLRNGDVGRCRTSSQKQQAWAWECNQQLLGIW